MHDVPSSRTLHALFRVDQDEAVPFDDSWQAWAKVSVDDDILCAANTLMMLQLSTMQISPSRHHVDSAKAKLCNNWLAHADQMSN